MGKLTMETFWTKRILAIYPGLIIGSLYLTGRGMADGSKLMPLPSEWVILLAIAIGGPIIHSFVLGPIKRDPFGYRIVAFVGAPFIILPFLGLVIGLSIYLLLTYLLITRCR
jgi:hypothetical protein